MKKILFIAGLCLALFVGYSFSEKYMYTNTSSQKEVAKEFDLEEILLKNGYAKIPLEKLFTGHLQLKLSVNGVEGSFLLDTGANVTTIAEKSTDKFLMKTEPQEELATGVGVKNIEVQNSMRNTLRLESLELSDYTLYVMNLDLVNQALLDYEIGEIDGIVGADILSEKEAIIDYAKLTLYLKI
ncbi:retropepsin-like aspartic protease [Kordia sp.]|uniref:retropepsin-like aspartic protease n=1 Tax=Kordia sp. TaxID=1965332 RepID=UPI0025BEE7CA|nr:retropepsin-like aspartic protease [Kordia sp.]MCH2193550.1 retroviral-like aspartic protease family protein [Kordia sp.]